jgi:ABC-type spermidine/putrescine transport system permease subunit I
MSATAPRNLSRGAFAALLLLPAIAIIAVAFVVPLARLATMSFSAKSGMLGAYEELLGEDVYWIVLWNTMRLAVIVTAITLALGFAIAMALAHLSGSWRIWLFACVVLPLWISVLVRTFSWMLILERNGPLNRILLAGGIVDQPLSFLFNFTGVIIGMVHVLLPYAALPIYAALVKIDPALMRASEGLGASQFTTFRRVVLPLAAKGVATAATFTFLLSLGFFITPAILGGAKATTISMLIDAFVNERLAWPLASAASMVLLALALGVIAIAARFVPVSGLAETR